MTDNIETLLAEVQKIEPSVMMCKGGTGLDADFIAVETGMIIDEAYGGGFLLSIDGCQVKMLRILRAIKECE